MTFRVNFRQVLQPLTLLVLLTVQPVQARAESLIADLSDHLVAITTGFVGTELLLFGSVDGQGDIVVVTHGPTEEVVVRKKAQVAGLWMNRESMEFEHVPAFYDVSATDGAFLNMTETIKMRHQVGARNLRFWPKEDVNPINALAYRRAIIRNKQKEGLYSSRPGLIERRGKRLFRTKVFFPTNVPTGTYIIETLLIQNGEVISAQTTPLFINKLGTGAQIFRFANVYPAFYGLAAILIAAIAGLLANWIFRKLT